MCIVCFRARCNSSPVVKSTTAFTALIRCNSGTDGTVRMKETTAYIFAVISPFCVLSQKGFCISAKNSFHHFPV